METLWHGRDPDAVAIARIALTEGPTLSDSTQEDLVRDFIFRKDGRNQDVLLAHPITSKVAIKRLMYAVKDSSDLEWTASILSVLKKVPDPGWGLRRFLKRYNAGVTPASQPSPQSSDEPL